MPMSFAQGLRYEIGLKRTGLDSGSEGECNSKDKVMQQAGFEV